MEHDIVIINSRNEIEEVSPLARMIKSPFGRRKLAESMAAPIRRNIDYQGIARRALVVDPLPSPALNDALYTSFIKGERVTVPQFQIVNSPTFKISDIKQRRFNLIDRTSPRRYDERVVISSHNTMEDHV